MTGASLEAVATDTPASSKGTLDRAVAQLDDVVVGMETPVRLSVACMLAGGHLLLEGLPGVGKTTLAHALAATFGLDYRRIQFTSDLLPSDVSGVTIFEQTAGAFRFHPGPVFSQVVLADEINRATPKTQSALLEAMEERQVTVDGESHALPQPFYVIATQNPTQLLGTFPLPEAQLDRFLVRVHLGFPDRAAERHVLEGEDRRVTLSGLAAVLDADALERVQAQVRSVHVTPALLDYVQDLIAHTRESGQFETGLSVRAGLAMISVAKAWALLQGDDAVVPEHVKAVFGAIAGHRLRPLEPGLDADGAARLVLDTVAIP